jgi:hypothetical protein
MPSCPAPSTPSTSSPRSARCAWSRPPAAT